MQRKQMVWREIEQRHGANSKACFLGNVRVGEVCWNSNKSRNDIVKDYIWECRLPGFKTTQGTNATEEDCMHTIQKCFPAYITMFSIIIHIIHHW